MVTQDTLEYPVNVRIVQPSRKPGLAQPLLPAKASQDPFNIMIPDLLRLTEALVSIRKGFLHQEAHRRKHLFLRNRLRQCGSFESLFRFPLPRCQISGDFIQ